MGNLVLPSGNVMHYSGTEFGHMIRVIDSGKAGPNLLVTGAVHGDEVCGPKAIFPMLEEFKSGLLKIDSGTVTFVPVCNLEAYAANTRYIKENMNRVWYPFADPQSIDHEQVQALLPIFENKTHYLDLHSVHTPSPAFVFNDQETPESRAMAMILGADYIVEGWAKLYPPTNPNETIPEEPDTLWYAKSKGVTGCLIECGDHTQPEAVAVARRAILNTFNHLGMMDTGLIIPQKPELLRMTDMVRRPISESFEFAEGVTNFARMEKGQLIARFSGVNNNELRAPHDGYMLVPFPGAKVGEEMIYWARPEVV